MSSEDLRLIPGARVLVAAHLETDARQIQGYLEAIGNTVFLAEDGEDALRRVRCDDPEIALLDARLPRPNAYQLCERLKAHPSTRSIPVVMMVPPDSNQQKVRGIAVGADDFLTLPIDEFELLARVKSLVRVKRLNDQMEATESVIFGLAEMLETKVSAAATDARRLSDYAALLGRAVGLGADDLEVLRKSAALHDIGKIAVREEVLLKSGSLSDEEFNEIKLHPEVGERICGPLPDADQILPVIRHQRERWDGRGYPDGLKGEQIPLLARILAIADGYDALRSARPYRPALDPEEARAALLAAAGKQWDPDLIQAFLNVLDEQEPAVAA